MDSYSIWKEKNKERLGKKQLSAERDVVGKNEETTKERAKEKTVDNGAKRREDEKGNYGERKTEKRQNTCIGKKRETETW